VLCMNMCQCTSACGVVCELWEVGVVRARGAGIVQAGARVRGVCRAGGGVQGRCPVLAWHVRGWAGVWWHSGVSNTAYVLHAR
jgi:hypothetical protein